VGTPRPLRPRRRRPVAVLAALLAASAIGLTACGSDDGASLPEGVVARVGDAPVNQQELDRVLAQSRAAVEAQGQSFPDEGSEEFDAARRQAMQQLFQLQVLDFEARRCGPPCRVTPAQVDEELDEIVEQQFQGKRAQLNAFLKERDITLAEARQQIRAGLQQEKIQAHVTRGVRFSAADAREYYDENRAQYRVAPTRTASHILVRTKAQADRLRAQATPQNFAQLARRNSLDTSNKEQGGDLGEIQRGQLVPEFERVAFAQRPGTISQPVRTQFGWHLILIRDTKPGRTVPFAEVRRTIIQEQLQAKRQETFQKWVEETLEEWQDRTVYADDELAPQEPEPAETAPEP
ncbi:MAG TPA: peptidylprolyl isomerase, partial [Miltoncostaeaceae bacterium]|nr:peptidylprolyl isomerase [Miltoncostaeaceae bacterium]